MASPLRPGALLIGKYRLRRPVGEGAMGVVWAALNEATAREVALKIVVQPDRDLRARLLREARACGRLNHRNVVEIYDAAQTERGEPFLVMPLLQGETLAALLRRRRRLSPHEAARIGRDIARGLAAAHASGIVHRDLKPSNVFLQSEPDESDYTVKLLDFGVSKVVATGHGFKTETGIIIGSPGYVSPEQIRSLPDIDHRADLWSLGVVLFEMLSGVRPFEGSIQVVLTQILGGDIPTIARLVRGLDPHLADVVAWCLQRDRENRVSSAADVAGWLEAFTSPGTLSPERRSVPEAREVHASAPALEPLVPPPLALPVSPADAGLEEHTTVPLGKRPAGPHAAGARAPAASLPNAAFPLPPTLPLDQQRRPRRAGWVAQAILVCAAGLLIGALIALLSIPFGASAPAASTSATGTKRPVSP